MAEREEGEKTQKGWYRYKMLFGATASGSRYEMELMLQKRGKTQLEDFPREEAQDILRQIANFIAKKADFKNLTEDF